MPSYAGTTYSTTSRHPPSWPTDRLPVPGYRVKVCSTEGRIGELPNVTFEYDHDIDR